MSEIGNRRLIEGAFPCNEVGAETKRERGSLSALPPVYYLHVWWARRPLTPSRAAVLGSLLPADTDPNDFLKSLGIQKKVALVGDQQWTLTGEMLDKITLDAQGQEVLEVDTKVLKAWEKENSLRAEQQATLKDKFDIIELSDDERKQLTEWFNDCEPLGSLMIGDLLPVKNIAASPVKANEKIELGKKIDYRFPGDAYGYSRAYASNSTFPTNGETVLDLTSGGGSIPFEALRCGCNVIANELNPVAVTILTATLDYPFRYGKDLIDDIQKWGNLLAEQAQQRLDFYADNQVLSNTIGGKNPYAAEDPALGTENIVDYLYCRVVTCPHCGKQTPLLNSCWLSQKSGNMWGVEVVPQGDSFTFRTYRVGANGKGPQGQDPESSTVNKGVGACVHCHQAIDSEEIKRQARGESHPGAWRDELYVIAANRYEPVLDKSGNVQRNKSGELKGQIKTKTTLFFRPANDTDRAAIAAAKAELEKNWDRWDRMGLIPTEKVPEGHKTAELLRFGSKRWCDLYTPRQLLGLLTLEETLLNLKPQILAELGPEKGKAVITYLQFAIDKIVDYNSRQTRWEYARCMVKGSFSRHDFSFKWTFGELILTGEDSGIRWGVAQVIKSYSEIANLVEPVRKRTQSNLALKIIHGSAEHMPEINDGEIDTICFDPPYYNNVQYAELSDFYYVWQKRTLADLYPSSYVTTMTNKKDEAVANPTRDGGVKQAKAAYEAMMKGIFAEARRVLKDNGVMVMMFTHKDPDAWETLTRSLIESGWTITSTFPVESETSVGLHTRDTASAESSIFITCRKRTSAESGTWIGFSGTGVKQRIEQAVINGLKELAPLRLNGVDEMVSAYGRALHVLSENWPVLDGDREISPKEAMLEASRVVSAAQIEKLSGGKLRFSNLTKEAAVVVTLLGLMGTKNISYDQALSLSRSLGIPLDQRSGGYTAGDFAAVAPKKELIAKKAVFAPLVMDKNKLSIVMPENRERGRVIENPQSEWDMLQGVILSFREGEIPVAKSYLERHCAGMENTVLALLDVWKNYAPDEKTQKEAAAILYGLKQ